jgi:hypothetical protein
MTETLEITEVLDDGSMPNEIVPHNESNLLAPSGTIEELVGRYKLQSEFINKVMKEGVDYGKIPGAGDKKVLLKAGAEKITTLFGLSIHFPKELQERVEDWTGENHGGEPFFFYEDTCQLTKDGLLIAEASGSCNSWEKKYRYRSPELKCPTCGIEGSVIKGKKEYGGGWVCWARKGGCGTNFPIDLADIVEQDTTPILNPFIFDLVNTFKKMSQKRGLVAVTLMAGNVSDHFTQDLEDMPGFDNSSEDRYEPTGEPALFRVNFPKAKGHFNGEPPTIAELFAVDPDYCDWISKQNNPTGEAMRDFVASITGEKRASEDKGYPTKEPVKSINTSDATKSLGTMLNGTSGPLTPSHFWSQVKLMGMGTDRAKEICDGLGQSDDWRKVLTVAYEEMRGLYEL